MTVKKLIGTKEAARILNRTRRQVTNYCRNGKLNAYLLHGRAWAIDWDSMERLKAELEAEKSRE